MDEQELIAFRAMIEKDRIRDLFARLAQAMDRVDVDTIRACYTEDSTDDHGAFTGTGAEFAERPVRKDPNSISSTHLLGQSLIDLRGDEAFAETYFFVPLVWDVDGVRTEIQTAGRYHDRVIKIDGEWKVAFRRVVMDWASERPAVPWSQLDTFARNQRWPDDLVYHRDRWTS